MRTISQIVSDFSVAIKAADARRPQAVNVRSKEAFQPGIGPHSEAKTVELVASDMLSGNPEAYSGRIATGVPYPDMPRQKCDLCIGTPPEWEWAIEVKLLRMLGDNGKLNDNILMHILSPYPEHRSALTDCEKLFASPLGKSRLTNKQLAMIFAVGKSKGLQTKEIKDKALATFSKNLNFLTKAEASTYINALQSM